MKYCKDWLPRRVRREGRETWLCRHPVAGWYRDIDVVTRKNQNLEVLCQSARKIGECGAAATRFWQAKSGDVGFRLTEVK
jgi:hypothetical protein